MVMAADRGIVPSVDTLELVERIRATRLYALKHTVSPAPVGLSQIAIAVALCLKDGNVHREAKPFRIWQISADRTARSAESYQINRAAARPFTLHRRSCGRPC